jgi:hypothetical protein
MNKPTDFALHGHGPRRGDPTRSQVRNRADLGRRVSPYWRAFLVTARRATAPASASAAPMKRMLEKGEPVFGYDSR